MSVLDQSTLDTEQLMASFDFGLDRRLTKAVAKVGFVYPTLVQVEVIPLALEGRDLLIKARTGSGKTAAYVLPLLQKILASAAGATAGGAARSREVQAVILVPTRELCEQTQRAIRSLSYFAGDLVSMLSLSGAAKPAAEAAALRDCPNVVVGTPARLLLHVRSGALDLSAVETLVVDEADMVLSFGHQGDVTSLVDSLPQTPQVFLVSATLSPELEDLKKLVLHSPTIVTLQEEEVNTRLAQFYVNVPAADRDLLVYALLTLKLISGKILFFVNEVDTSYRLKLLLEQFSVRSAVLNGQLPANSREHVLQQFNRGVFDILIATDTSLQRMGGAEQNSAEAGDDGEEDDGPKKKKKKKGAANDGSFGVSRGVDFIGVQFVINYDVPGSVDDYIHRVGRTARGTETGTAITLVDPANARDVALLTAVQEFQPALPGAGTAAGGDEAAALEEASAAASAAAAAAGGDTEMAAENVRRQPEHLQLDMREVESFRYRVADVSKVVSRLAVREARLQEVRQQLTNSERLSAHFDDNPRDLQVLRHDHVARPAVVQPHLASVPSYLLPDGVRHEQERQARKRRRGGQKRASGKGQDGGRNRASDPLQSFGVPAETTSRKGGAATFYADDVGGSGARRNQWKKAHNKGRYNKNRPKGKGQL